MENNIVAINDIEVAARIVGQEDDNPYKFITRNGVTLDLHPVPSMLIQEINRRFPVPKPPMVFIEDKGREEENPNDPEYQDLINQQNIERGLVMVDVLLTGVEVSKVPEGTYKVDDEEWEYYCEIVGVPVSDKKIARTLAWLKYYILDNDDLLKLRDKLLRLSGGTLETDVKEATDSFRSDEERPPTRAVRASRKN